jgi:hypothetical protein
MAIRRYNNVPIIVYGKKYGTSQIIAIIRENIASGNISYSLYSSKENERLDILAGTYYGDGSLWWILAAASNIGWGLQIPAGTVIRIPNLNDINKYIG